MMQQATLPLGIQPIRVGTRVRLPHMPGPVNRHQWGNIGVVVKLLEEAPDLGHLWLIQMEDAPWDHLNMLGIHLREGEIL